MQPITHSAFRYYRYEPSDLDDVEPLPAEILGGGLQRFSVTMARSLTET